MSKIEPYFEKVKSAVNPTETIEIYAQIKELKGSDGTPKEFTDLICACISNLNQNIYRCASTLVNLVKWKTYPEGTGQIVDQLMIKPNTEHLEKDGTIDSSATREVWREVSSFAGNITEVFKNTIKLNEQLAEKWCKFILKSMVDCHKWYLTIMPKVIEILGTWEMVSMPLKEEFLKTLIKFANNHPDPAWHKNMSTNLYLTCSFLQLTNLMRTEDVKWKNCFDLMFQLHKETKSKEMVINHDLTFFGTVIGLVTVRLYVAISAKQWKIEKMKEFLPTIFEWRDRDENELEQTEIDGIKTNCDRLVQHLYTNEPTYLRDSDIESFCKIAVEVYNYITMQSLNSCYTNGNDKIKRIIEKYMNNLLQFFVDGQNLYQCTCNMLTTVFKSNPKLINNATIQKIEDGMKANGADISSICLLREMVTGKKEEFSDRGNTYFDMARKADDENNRGCTIMMINIFQQIATIDKGNCERIIAMFENEMIVYQQKSDVLVSFFSVMYQLVSRYPEVFRKHIPMLESYKKFPQVKTSAQGIIDIVEGRSLAKVSNDVEQQGKDIKVLDDEVGKTKNNVAKLDKRVDQHDVDIKDNRDNILNTQKDVDQLGERVDKAEDKIVDIDNKTVSNAPSWSKEVSKLLNPKTNNDWTLVAQRLNYSSSDIRGWATQSDPTMSLLAEFYTTNKTADATKYLVKVLKDANRLDAVAVIQKYEKLNESVVGDDDTGYKVPPTVFISYQWGVQTQVKMLKDRIEKEGYTCWMDLGQMGGGDMLYEKIDNGIRSAKIVLMCMTDLYCKSANCIREVNLANGLDKVILPLLFEKTLTWPPPGSMGPILAGKLFIRFFQRDNEKTNDERYWPPDKYDEMMDKIRGAVGPPPNQVAVSATTTATVPASFAANTAPAGFAANTAPTAKKSYHVCISCSPDKEPTMKALQRDLQSAGFETKICSYIEDSVANFQAQVYITAICLRYTKSSLAVNEIEAIQNQNKPLIVLMFDRSEYPPMGPLKKYLAKVTPINCTYNNPNTGSDQFEKIIELINTYKSNGYKPSESVQRRRSLSDSKADSDSTSSQRPATASKNRRSDSDHRGSSDRTNDSIYDQPKLTRRNVNGQENNNPKKLYQRPPREEEPTYYNPDGPKLPSLYKQRVNNRY